MNETAGDPVQPAQRPVGPEAKKTLAAKYQDGFIARYLSGDHILDIGYRGYVEEAVVPIVPQAIGIDLNYPGYDGRTLPFADYSQDAVYSSHCLEHIDDYVAALREWQRVLRIGGFMIVTVPHQFLYEKRAALPSRFNADHKRFYTPGSLLAEVEAALEPNTYRLRHLADNDKGYTYWRPPETHPGGNYEIEMVLERIARPAWLLTHDIELDIGPDSTLIEWRGFSPCEPGFRWTEGTRAVMRFALSQDTARSIDRTGTRIGIWYEAFGRQRLRIHLNQTLAYEGECPGGLGLVDFAPMGLRPGSNEIFLELPDATRPAGPGDPRHLGIAIRGIRLLREIGSDQGPGRGIGAAIGRLLKGR